MSWKTASGIPANRQSNQDDTKEQNHVFIFSVFGLV